MKTKRILSIVLTLAMLLGVAAAGGSFSLEAQAAAPLCNVGDIIEFGSYPQSRVTNSTTVSALNAQSKTWKSYGYSSSEDHEFETTTVGDWMQYADVTYNGSQYRAVKFTKFRPRRTHLSNSTDLSFQDENGYGTNYTYWFKYEPVKWRVLDPSTGLVLSEVCLDSREFSVIRSSETFYPGYDEDFVTKCYDHEGLANRYGHDFQIRYWLNYNFLYYGAFSLRDRDLILSTNVYDITTEKIFLLSEEDAEKSAYGLSSDADRKARCTDYAAAQGCEIDSGYSSWWTLTHIREDGYDTGRNVRIINSDGSFDDRIVDSTDVGVRPAMRLNLPMILVGEVSVTGVTAPVAGATANFNYNIPSGAHYFKDSPKYAAWVETDTQPTTFDDLLNGTHHWNDGNSFTFKANKYYTFRADVVAEENFIFSDPFSAKINGNTANVRDGGSYKSIWYCFGKLNTLISSVNITGVTAPVAGATANFNFTLPSGAGYAKHSSAVWIETDTQPTVFDDLSTGTNHWYFDTSGSFTFKPNKYYTLCAYIAPIAGYAFSSSLTAKINGNTAKIQTRTNYNLIWYCFGKTAAASTVINTVTINGVTAPVVGATASFNYTLPSGAGYVKDGTQNAAWIETDSKPNTYEDLSSGTIYWSNGSGFTFKPNKYYTFRADIKASSGYTFSSSFTAKINGNTASIRDGIPYKTIWYCFGKTGSGSVKTLSSISVTTQPNKKIYAAGENFNKAGMVVKANYSDGTSATITGYTVTDGNNLPAGKTSVTLSYTEGGVTKTATVAITVSSSTATLTGIEITSPPAKTSYNYKSSVSTAGLKVTAKYSDNTTKDVTDQVSVSGFDTTQKGTFNATVKLEDKTATFSYTVSYAWWQWIIVIVLFGWLWY